MPGEAAADLYSIEWTSGASYPYDKECISVYTCAVKTSSISEEPIAYHLVVVYIILIKDSESRQPVKEKLR